jgi:sugar O-acyltransferase (sialic acid O-acetyltransferase NeuD family)
MMRLAILGAGGHGRVVADTALSAGWEKIIFYDDAWPDIKLNGEWEVTGDTSTLIDDIDKYDGVIIAIGNNVTRFKKTEYLIEHSIPLVTIIHPSATLSSRSKLGIGTVVFAGAVINYGVELGFSSIINTHASVDHDCKLGNAIHVSPGVSISGGVSIGDSSWIGIGASVQQYVCIGSQVVVGSGAAVIDDVPDGLTVVGVPARPLKEG